MSNIYENIYKLFQKKSTLKMKLYARLLALRRIIHVLSSTFEFHILRPRFLRFDIIMITLN